ncbi:hypothetical protein ACFW9O_26125 [Streptomyces sp. NPDC059499]|uniref:hypothetical protein n=1 Tax=Streptomyces sp. NPDC059499 TaxID=3346852 RepID=UPI0036BFAE3C
MTTPATDHTPDYPPRTPPPPKRPLSPPRPDTASEHEDVAEGWMPERSGRRGVGMVNRRGANWVLESAPWAAGKARTAIVGQLQKWGYRPAAGTVTALEAVVTLLVDAATTDPGTRITVHLSDQEGQACILTLSHSTSLTSGHEDGGDDVLHRITAHPSVSGCGTDTGPDGRRTWAVLGL